MHINTCASSHLIFFFCIILKNCHTFKNDATEILYTQVLTPVAEAPSNTSLNRARNGGRSLGNTERRVDRSQVGCRELRSTKYISDGQCTSINPIKELVCAGECLPAQMLPNWIGGSYGRKFWSRRNDQDWRCVNDKTRTQRIQLQCQNGSTRTYKITVVTSCKCKRYSRQHNESAHKFEDQSRAQPVQKVNANRRHVRGEQNENWHEARPKN
uniref:Sclerostin domain-containing protein 1 n=1 Tax=Paramormyrops kingsleyae TaxID=1676925 RepID=A0A3B3SM67_9TELE|nr:sclerostin domain-containing protein 1 isoform X1 [Paramormyrops kingsleyae]